MRACLKTICNIAEQESDWILPGAATDSKTVGLTTTEQQNAKEKYRTHTNVLLECSSAQVRTFAKRDLSVSNRNVKAM